MSKARKKYRIDRYQTVFYQLKSKLSKIPAVLNIVNSPVWDSPFVVEPYIVQPGDNTNQERSEGSSKG